MGWIVLISWTGEGLSPTPVPPLQVSGTIERARGILSFCPVSSLKRGRRLSHKSAFTLHSLVELSGHWWSAHCILFNGMQCLHFFRALRSPWGTMTPVALAVEVQLCTSQMQRCGLMPQDSPVYAYLVNSYTLIQMLTAKALWGRVRCWNVSHQQVSVRD